MRRHAVLFLTTAAIALSGPPIVSGQSGTTPLPALFGEYLAQHVRLTADKYTQLLQGQPVTQLLEADPSNEVGVFGAVWIEAPMARYLAAVRDIEQFEKGGNFLVTRRISAPPRLDDFAAIRLAPEDLADLRKCRVGSCAVKLSEAALVDLRQDVDWSKPDAATKVDAVLRQMALDYVNGYLAGGDARLAAYRDSSRPTFVGQEFASMIARMPSLTLFLPDVKQYLLDFPKVTLPDSESFLYWQDVKFGLKPTIRINHLTIAERPASSVVVSKMLYATHYFWTAIELRVLIADPARGEGFWFANVNRSRSDGLSGFVGALIRGRVRGDAEKGMLSALESTKAKMEAR